MKSMSSSDPPSVAAAAQVISKSGSLIIDIDNMKVPELKKRLKSMGLSTTGNKAELIERLQEAYLSEKDGSVDGTLDDESLEEALLNDDPDQSAIPETLLGNEEIFSSPEKDASKIVQSPVTKPLKKRAVIQTSTPSAESPKITKPLVIKRDNYPTVEPPPTTIKKDHPLIEPPKSNENSKATKLTTEADRLQLRAKRFNIDSKISSDSAKTAVAPKITTAKGPVAVQAPASVKSNNLDILRKRAERFGENVSTVMKQLENQEKLMKRKLKFTDSSSESVSLSNKASLSSEQEKKKKRLERFGLKN